MQFLISNFSREIIKLLWQRSVISQCEDQGALPVSNWQTYQPKVLRFLVKYALHNGHYMQPLFKEV